MSNYVLFGRSHGLVREDMAQDSSSPHMFCVISHVPYIHFSCFFWPSMVVVPLPYVCFGAINFLVSRRGVSHESVRTITIY